MAVTGTVSTPSSRSEAEGVVQHPLLQPGDALQSLLADVVPDAALDGGHRVLAEVVAVPLVDRLQQQADLEVLDVRWASGRTLSLASDGGRS
jgi:hypothetical protein